MRRPYMPDRAPLVRRDLEYCYCSVSRLVTTLMRFAGGRSAQFLLGDNGVSPSATTLAASVRRTSWFSMLQSYRCVRRFGLRGNGAAPAVLLQLPAIGEQLSMRSRPAATVAATADGDTQGV